ncbi:Wzt carbohydrate-binding domain-containing protein [bacterium]|nr:Wzt carbohydrate-binding domain-containing protein [bacterium]
MNLKAVLKVKNVSKTFSLKKSKSLGRWFSREPISKTEQLVLNNISFDLYKGETVGIIGQNGAGKSTLLKIISNLISPDAGEVLRMNSNINCIIELGHSFESELTGRENVVQLLKIKGFASDQIGFYLKAIQNFAHINEYFDQPVKKYSTGMKVRLAFSAEIMGNPDILIVDEALSVGDALFQHKCFNKIKSMQEAGLSILFVSHDLNAISQICDRVLYLSKGSVRGLGDPDDMINLYLKDTLGRVDLNSIENIKDADTNLNKTQTKLEERDYYNPNETRSGNQEAKVIDVRLKNKSSKIKSVFTEGEKLTIEIDITTSRLIESPVIGFALKSISSMVIYGTNTRILDQKVSKITEHSNCTFSFSLPLCLQPAEYFLDIGIAENPSERHLDVRYSCVQFLIIKGHATFDGTINLNADFSG